MLDPRTDTQKLSCTWCNGPSELPDPAHPDEEVEGPVSVLYFDQGIKAPDAPALHRQCVEPYKKYLEERDAADQEGSWWLVEEQFGSDLGSITDIHHWFVNARTPEEAFLEARRDALTAGKQHWYFGANELMEGIKGYLWAAADGSSVCYEVRKVGKYPFTSLVTDKDGSYGRED